MPKWIVYFLMFGFGIPIKTVASSEFYNVPDCDTPTCTIFEVKISIDTKNNKEESIRLSKSFYIPGDPEKHYKYYETIVKKQDSCSKKVEIPYPIYRSVVKVLGQIAGTEDGMPAPTLTPAQNTILLLYTTIMQQTVNFDCSEQLLKKLYGEKQKQEHVEN